MTLHDLTHLTPDEAQAEYRRLTGQGQRRQKFGAQRTEYAGQVYDSAGEADHAAALDLRVRAGQIAGWRRGTHWLLMEGTRRTERIVYVPDFEILDAAGAVVEVRDFKGVLTPVFRLKAKLFRRRYPGVPLVVVRADGSEERL